MALLDRIAAFLRARPRALIFLVSLLVYNANLRPVASGDSVPAALFPFAVVVDHSLNFDRYRPYCAKTIIPNTYFFRKAPDGHRYSLYPIGLPALLTPLYAPFILASGARDWPAERIVDVALRVEKVPASLIASLSVALMFGLLRRLVDGRRALLLTIVFAFGTETWTISSQALWQHGAGALAVIASLDSLLAASGDGRLRRLALAGLFAGAGVAIRPTHAAFLLASYAAVLSTLARRDVVGVLAYSIGPSIFGALVAGYNLATFGDLRGGYAVPAAVAHAFDSGFLLGLAGLLVSPSRGLFVYCPVLIFSLFGAFVWCRSREDRLCPPVYLVALATSVCHILSFAKWTVWWGGYTYGPRYMTDIGPYLVLLMVPGLRFVLSRSPLRGLFGLALAASIAVQTIGAFCYPNGEWDASPASIDAQPDRLWDWRDNQIRRTFSAGLVRDRLDRRRRAPEPTQAELSARFESAPRRLFQLEGDWASRSTFVSLAPGPGEVLGRLTASSDDPCIILPPFDIPERARLALRVEITAPADTVLQVFFTTVADPVFSASRCVSAPLVKGRNRVSLELPELDLAGRLRLDPGAVPGEYTLHSVEVRY
jgi:hypothetical protein